MRAKSPCISLHRCYRDCFFGPRARPVQPIYLQANRRWRALILWCWCTVHVIPCHAMLCYSISAPIRAISSPVQSSQAQSQTQPIYDSKLIRAPEFLFLPSTRASNLRNAIVIPLPAPPPRTPARTLRSRALARILATRRSWSQPAV